MFISGIDRFGMLTAREEITSRNERKTDRREMSPDWREENQGRKNGMKEKNNEYCTAIITMKE